MPLLRCLKRCLPSYLRLIFCFCANITEIFEVLRIFGISLSLLSFEGQPQKLYLSIYVIFGVYSICGMR